MSQAADGARMMAEGNHVTAQGRKRRDAAIRKMAELGLPMQVIADAAGVTRQTVHRVLQ